MSVEHRHWQWLAGIRDMPGWHLGIANAAKRVWRNLSVSTITEALLRPQGWGQQGKWVIPRATLLLLLLPEFAHFPVADIHTKYFLENHNSKSARLSHELCKSCKGLYKIVNARDTRGGLSTGLTYTFGYVPMPQLLFPSLASLGCICFGLLYHTTCFSIITGVPQSRM